MTNSLRVQFRAVFIVLTALALCGNSWTKTATEWAAEVGVDMNVSYEATRVVETKSGSFQMYERKAPKKMAMEMDMGGMKGTMIMREDLNTAYFTMPSMGMYRTIKMNEALKQSNQDMHMQTFEKVGRETINGFESTKYKTAFKDDNGSGEGFTWIADVGVLIKMDMVYQSRKRKGERMVMQLTNLKLVPQKPSYFELPPGLKPFGLGGIMGSMRQNN